MTCWKRWYGAQRGWQGWQGRGFKRLRLALLKAFLQYLDSAPLALTAASNLSWFQVPIAIASSMQADPSQREVYALGAVEDLRCCGRPDRAIVITVRLE